MSLACRHIVMVHIRERELSLKVPEWRACHLRLVSSRRLAHSHTTLSLTTLTCIPHLMVMQATCQLTIHLATVVFMLPRERFTCITCMSLDQQRSGTASTAVHPVYSSSQYSSLYRTASASLAVNGILSLQNRPLLTLIALIEPCDRVPSPSSRAR